MKTPPLLMGASLLFWGWQTGLWIWAVPMSFVVEASRYLPYRWDWTPRDFYRLSDFSALLLMGMVAFRFIAGTESMVRWLPIGLFPLLCGQCYGRAGGVDRGALFYTARKKEKEERFRRRRTVDVSYLYLACVIIAASAANQRTPFFYAGMTLLVGWALGYRRPPARRGSFLLVFVPAAVIGFGASIGLHNLQVWLETDVIQWMTDRRQAGRNPFRSTTAIGEIGKLKQHDRILMRVKPIGSFRAGQLLHEASFNRYRNGLWIAGQARFEPLSPAGFRNSGVWNLERPPPENGFAYEITMKLRDGKGMLPLPMGCYQIRSLPAEKLERNPYGAYRVSAFSPFLMYRARYHPSVRRQDDPNENDWELPASERETVIAQLKTRHWKGGSPKEGVEFVRNFFRSGFTYSLEQESPGKGSTPLAHFLQVSHSGHCEFFATATVLMLRGAGIPARYATGYAVSEYSRLEKAFVVRSRHAHAWALAYLDGSWVPVDTTPSIWLQAEQEQSGILTPVVDLIRWAGHRFDIWRNHYRAGGGFQRWLLLALSGGIVLLWRVLRKKASKKRQSRSVSETVDETTHPASPFTAVQESLIDAGFSKNRWEPPGEWIARLSRSGMPADTADALQSVVLQHYRICFHSGGLSDDELRQMKIQCRSVLESLSGIQQESRSRETFRTFR